MSYDHLNKGTMAFHKHVEELEKQFNDLQIEARTLRRCNDALRQDNKMLRSILDNQVEAKGFEVIDGGLSQSSINVKG